MVGGRGAPHTIPEQGAMDQGLWFLTNQLYCPTTPCITPTLRIGFAVDYWGGVIENRWFLFRSISKKSYFGQASAAIEGEFRDTSYTISNHDARQVGAVIEDVTSDAGDTIRDRDAGQFGTVTEGFPSYTGDAVRYRDTCQAPAVREGPFPDSIYAITNRDARQALRVLSLIHI